MRHIAIIIPHFNGVDMLRRMLDSIRDQETQHHIVTVVVDNGSTDGSRAMLSEWSEFGSNRFVVLAEKNLGYGQGANRGMAFLHQFAPIPDVLICNNDMKLLPFCIDNLAAVLDWDKDVGIVGGKLFYENGIIQHAGAFFNAEWFGMHYGQMRKANDYADTPTPRVMLDHEFVTGALLLIRGEVLPVVGGFDPAYGLGYYEDADLCFRVRAAGWKVVYTPHAHAIHYEGTTSRHMGNARSELILRNRNIFINKWAVPEWDE